MERATTTPCRARWIVAAFLLAVMLVVAGCAQVEPKGIASSQSPVRSWSVYFSPDGGATGAVVNAVRHARRTILVQAYSFTSAPIAKALVGAHKRGVDVKVILDKSNVTAKYSSAVFLLHMGIPTWIDRRHAIAHNKIMIIDAKTVITGSFNFTRAAETRNAENLLIIDDPALAKRYADNWQLHRKHSERYMGNR